MGYYIFDEDYIVKMTVIEEVGYNRFQRKYSYFNTESLKKMFNINFGDLEDGQILFDVV